MARTRTLVAPSAALLLVLTACASGGTVPEQSTPPSATPAPTVAPGSLPTPSAPTGSPIDVPDASWDAILAALSALGVTGTPTLVSAESVRFSDGSLGCPKPGTSYTQAVVDGMRVVVSVDGTEYDYRFGARADAPVLCEGGLRR
ncbi:MAG: hypothetical protein QM602_09375 [Microbacterium sp.]